MIRNIIFTAFGLTLFSQLTFAEIQKVDTGNLKNLILDGENGPIGHPDVEEMFDGLDGERYLLRPEAFN